MTKELTATGQIAAVRESENNDGTAVYLNISEEKTVKGFKGRVMNPDSFACYDVHATQATLLKPGQEVMLVYEHFTTKAERIRAKREKRKPKPTNRVLGILVK